MKNILILLSFFLVAGCAELGFEKDEESCAPIEVWNPPKVTMPERPTMLKSDNANDQQTIRNMNIDIVNITRYATELEQIIQTLLKPTK